MFLFFFFLFVSVCLQRQEDMPNLLELELQEYVLPNIRAGIQTQERDGESRALNTELSLQSPKSYKLFWFRAAFDP